MGLNKVVDFSTAKLLKEKGFDEPCYGGRYYNNGKEHVRRASKYVSILDSYVVLSPTIADVVMWLYEKHGIWIDVVLSRNEKRFTFMIQSLSFDANKFLNEYFNSPIEAYKAAFDYILNNNLI